jgi:HTH-type transcriptional regulator/antitoxin HipB
MEYRIQTLSQLKPIIQGFRRKSGLTQAAMAERLGVSQQAYAQIESNLSSTSVERLYTILRLLNIDINFVSSTEVQMTATEIISDSSKMVEKQKRRTDLSKKREMGVSKKLALVSPAKLSKRSDTTKW